MINVSHVTQCKIKLGYVMKDTKFYKKRISSLRYIII